MSDSEAIGAGVEQMPELAADIFEAAGTLRRQGEMIAAQEGQSQARWQVLHVIGPRPKTVPQIARRLGITRQAVQRVINDLLAQRLVAQVANPDHRTSPLIGLTDDGTATLDRLTARARAYNLAVADALGDCDVNALRRGLQTLIQAVQPQIDGRP